MKLGETAAERTCSSSTAALQLGRWSTRQLLISLVRVTESSGSALACSTSYSDKLIWSIHPQPERKWSKTAVSNHTIGRRSQVQFLRRPELQCPDFSLRLDVILPLLPTLTLCRPNEEIQNCLWEQTANRLQMKTNIADSSTTATQSAGGAVRDDVRIKRWINNVRFDGWIDRWHWLIINAYWVGWMVDAWMYIWMRWWILPWQTLIRKEIAYWCKSAAAFTMCLRIKKPEERKAFS